MTRSTKLGAIGIFACGLVVLVVLIFGQFPRARFWAARVRPWDSRAIAGTFAGVRVQEIDPSHAAVVFFYDLENNTDNDYRLTKGPNVVIMSRLKPSGSLSSDRQASLESAAFVPARNRTRIAVEMTDPFDWPAAKDAAAERDFREFVAAEVADLDGFVLFDQAARYQIELSINVLELQQPGARKGPD